MGTVIARVPTEPFSQFVRHLKDIEPVAIAIAAQTGIYREAAWKVYMQQQKRQCVLMGRLANQAMSTAFWRAMHILANLE
jgi:hypothetical protein